MSQVFLFNPKLSQLTMDTTLSYLASVPSIYVFAFPGINAYVIAFTALAGGTSWPDLIASKIAAERQTTADSAIANITCRFICQLTMQLPYTLKDYAYFKIFTFYIR